MLYLGNIPIAGLTKPLVARNVGEIVWSLIPLTDAGLHLLDGSLILGSGIYQGFVDYIAELYDNTSYIDKTFIQPTLTANGTLGGSSFAVSASAEGQVDSNPYRTYEAFDNNSSTYWRAGATTGWIEFYNPTPLKVTNLRWSCFYNYPTEGNVQGSNDGSTWTTLTTWTNSSASDFNISLSSNTNYYKYYRINITGVNTDVIHCAQINITATYQEKSAFCTEEQWQNSVTQYGSCGKFVYDSTNNTVRLPKVSDILQSTTDINALGDLIEAGLPNITGNTTREIKSSSTQVPTTEWNGAIGYQTGSSGSYGGSTTTYRTAFLYLDASKSNPIYGNSNTVQPQTIKAFVYIVVANSTKTNIEVDIDEIATDLNNKVNKDFSNLTQSIKNFDGQWTPVNRQLANNVAWNNTSTAATYDISSYLPDDNYNYEVMISGQATASATQQKFCTIQLTSDIQTSNLYLASARTTTTSTINVQNNATIIIPVGTGRYITQYASTSSNASGVYSLWIKGYRRIGTNA